MCQNPNTLHAAEVPLSSALMLTNVAMNKAHLNETEDRSKGFELDFVSTDVSTEIEDY